MSGRKNFRIHLNTGNLLRIKALAKWNGESIDRMINRLIYKEIISCCDSEQEFDKKILMRWIHGTLD